MPYDVTLDLVPEVGNSLEFARGKALSHKVAAQFVLEHFLPVQAMVDLIAADHDAGLVPFPGWFCRLNSSFFRFALSPPGNLAFWGGEGLQSLLQ
jgi:hypothetical protein